MQKWLGSSGVCLNEKGQVLMVLQGKPEEKKTWSIPSGGKELGETFEECCIREIEEETGYKTEIIKKIKVKRMTNEPFTITVEVHYFLVKLVSGQMKLQDPDQLIYDISWKSIDDIRDLELSFPEDRDFLVTYLTNEVHSD